MLITPALLHKEPLGSPTADVGMLVIDRFSTNAQSSLSDVILLPTICEFTNVDVVFD